MTPLARQAAYGSTLRAGMLPARFVQAFMRPGEDVVPGPSKSLVAIKPGAPMPLPAVVAVWEAITAGGVLPERVLTVVPTEVAS